jgi:unsaturated chondroitin disaccharide hydrolase
VAARESGNVEVLMRAINAADWFINNLPEDGVPYWDFDREEGNNARDTSASAIAAAGLWILSDLVSQSVHYQETSKRLIDNLLNENYISISSDESYLLKQATGAFTFDSEVNTSLIYADYYLIEAILLQEGIIQRPL